MIYWLSNSETFGYIAAILTTIAFFPQLLRTWRTKTANDVSILMLLLFLIGVFCWIIYGWMIHSPPIFIANLITFILNILILSLKLSYQDNLLNKS